MVVHSPLRPVLATDLSIAQNLGASCVEVLPRWNAIPPASDLADTITRSGMEVWSVHGPWGGQAIQAWRVDLADTNPRLRQESADDALRAADWAAALGAKVLVLHPGGLSDANDFDRRADGLCESLDRIVRSVRGTGLRIGVENMPKGVYPGSRMADLATIVRRIGQLEIGLVLDTGHAHISADIVSETLAAKDLLISTHVHDNDGRADSHQPPGAGSIDWPRWFEALNAIGYSGPIMLECIRALRERNEPISPKWLQWWQLTMSNRSGSSK